MNSTTLSFNPTINKRSREYDPDESLFGDIDYPSDDIANENQQPQDLDKIEDAS
jgi:hypothetical protein